MDVNIGTIRWLKDQGSLVVRYGGKEKRYAVEEFDAAYHAEGIAAAPFPVKGCKLTVGPWEIFVGENRLHRTPMARAQALGIRRWVRLDGLLKISV